MVIASAGLADAAPSPQKGLLPEWVGSRAVLHGQDPYQPEVARQIANGLYPGEHLSGSEVDQHRFAYPVFFAFLFFPAAVLPFEVAQKFALAGGALLTYLSIGWWLHDNRPGKLAALTMALLVFASYPTVLALQLRQPTLIIAAVLAAAFSGLRSGRMVPAGILAGLSTAKPQLAIAVVLPLSIWSLARWRQRKAFLLSLSATVSALLMASERVVPGWFSHWLSTLLAYSHYTGANPLLQDALARYGFLPAAMLLVGAVVWASWKFQDTDLLFAVSLSVASFQLLFLFQIYNEILLLPALLWLVENAGAIRARGQLHRLLLGCVWILLATGWAGAAGLTALNRLLPGWGLTLWQLPLAAAWLCPWAVFLTLAWFAFSSQKQPHLTSPTPAMLRRF